MKSKHNNGLTANSILGGRESMNLVPLSAVARFLERLLAPPDGGVRGIFGIWPPLR